MYRTNGSIWITVQSSSLLSHPQNCCAKYHDGHSGLSAAELPWLPTVCWATTVSRSLSLRCSAHHSLLFIIHHQLYIKYCGKVSLSNWNNCWLGFGAGKRRQHANQTSEVIFLLLWWDSVCWILVFRKLYYVIKDTYLESSYSKRQHRDASRWEFILSSLTPLQYGIDCHLEMFLCYRETLARSCRLAVRLVSTLWNLTGRSPISGSELEHLTDWVDFTSGASLCKQETPSQLCCENLGAY